MFQLVATVLLVVCMLAPSLAAPLREEGKIKAVLQAIRTIIASENHGRGELQAENAPIATSAPSNQPPSPTCTAVSDALCQIDLTDRIECGDRYSTTAEQCKEYGCCWCPLSIPGAPSCYYKLVTPQCQIDLRDRIACGGIYNTTVEQCEKYRCCWRHISMPGAPQCYHGLPSETAKFAYFRNKFQHS